MTTLSLTQRSRAVIPGGVNSPVRAFKSVGGDPLFAARAEGPWLHTRDGRRLIDFCLSFGPMILGHADPDVVAAIRDAAGRGTSYAVTTEAEIEMAELLTRSIPTMEKVRLVNSGTEAVMTALRLARGVTGRRKILKFSGCYHGHTDGMLVKAGSGVAGIASASSAGVSEQVAGDTLVAPYNDVPAAGGRAAAGRGSDGRAADGRSDARGASAPRSGAPRTGGAPRAGASAGGQRSGRPATGQRAAAGAKSAGSKSGGSAAVWSSNTGGTSGGSYGGGGNGRSGEGRPARGAGPRRASAPASNERRSR